MPVINNIFISLYIIVLGLYELEEEAVMCTFYRGSHLDSAMCSKQNEG